MNPIPVQNSHSFQNHCPSDQTANPAYQSNTTCTICFEEINPNDKLKSVAFSCHHYFHSQCIQKMKNVQLNANPETRIIPCPNCRVEQSVGEHSAASVMDELVGDIGDLSFEEIFNQYNETHETNVTFIEMVRFEKNEALNNKDTRIKMVVNTYLETELENISLYIREISSTNLSTIPYASLLHQSFQEFERKKQSHIDVITDLIRNNNPFITKQAEKYGQLLFQDEEHVEILDILREEVLNYIKCSLCSFVFENKELNNTPIHEQILRIVIACTVLKIKNEIQFSFDPRHASKKLEWDQALETLIQDAANGTNKSLFDSLYQKQFLIEKIKVFMNGYTCPVFETIYNDDFTFDDILPALKSVLPSNHPLRGLRS